MTELIAKEDPRYFSQTSDGSYDRHHYRIVCQTKSFVVESWDEVQGVDEVTAQFIPTQKNKPAENFLADNGFEKEGDSWIYKLNSEIKVPNHLKVETE